MISIIPIDRTQEHHCGEAEGKASKISRLIAVDFNVPMAICVGPMSARDMAQLSPNLKTGRDERNKR